MELSSYNTDSDSNNIRSRLSQFRRLNVCGLRSRLNCQELLEFLSEYDVICIREKCRPFRRQITDLVLNVSFWPELEHKMAFVYARKDDAAVTSF